MTRDADPAGAADPADVLPFDQLSPTGVLWLINRVVFHPRGFALAIVRDQADGHPVGWQVRGDGTEPWVFTGSNDEPFQAVEAFLAERRPRP